MLIPAIMKRIIFTLAALFIISAASAQRKQLRQFTNDFSQIASTHRIGLSFVPLRVVSWFIPKRAFDGDAADIKWALKKVKSLKLYTIQLPEGEPVPKESIAMLKSNLQKEGDFEPLVEMRHKGSNVHLLTDGKGNERIDNLVVLVQDEEEMIMVHLRTRLTVSDLSRIINKFQDKETVAEGSGVVAQNK